LVEITAQGWLLGKGINAKDLKDWILLMRDCLLFRRLLLPESAVLPFQPPVIVTIKYDSKI